MMKHSGGRYQYVPAPCEVSSIPSGLSTSMILLRPKSVILASKLFTPEPRRMLPGRMHQDQNQVSIKGSNRIQIVSQLTRFKIKVDDWGSDLIEVLQCIHCLNNDSPSL